MNLSKPGVLKCSSYSASLFVKAVSYGLSVCVEYKVSCFGQVINHGGCLSWHFNDSGKAAFDWVVYSYCT